MKSDREGGISYDITYMRKQKKKKDTSNINRLMDFQKEITVARRKDGIVREFGKDMDTLLYLK